MAVHVRMDTHICACIFVSGINGAVVLVVCDHENRWQTLSEKPLKNYVYITNNELDGLKCVGRDDIWGKDIAWWQRAYPDLLYHSFGEYCIIKVVLGQTPVCCQAMLQGAKKITLKCFCTRASISETTEETITQSVSSLMTQKHKEYMPQQRTSKGYTIVLQRSWQHQVSPFIFVKQMFFYHVISRGKEACGTLRASYSERYSLVWRLVSLCLLKVINPHLSRRHMHA